MGFRIFRRFKTVLLTFGLLSLGLYMLLNTLSEEFSMDNELSQDSSYHYHPRDVNTRTQKFRNVNTRTQKIKQSNQFNTGFMVQQQRKPKTMDLLQSDDLPESTVELKPQKYPNKKETDMDEIVKNSNNNMQGGYKLKYQEDSYKITAKEVEDYKAMNTENDAAYDSNNDEEYYDKKDEDYDDDDDDDYDDDADDEQEAATNAPFKPGDFGDIKGMEFYKKPKLKYEDVVEDDKGPVDKDKGLVDNDTAPEKTTSKLKHALVENGIFWTHYVETLIPKGLSYANVTKLLQRLRGQVVKVLDKPSWDRCGRPLNGYAVLRDGTRLCVRYRQPQTSFVYGEVLSFYLSRLLQMDNVPAVILAKTDSTSKQWRAVNISSLAWKENKTVAFIQWVDNINNGASSKAYIPPIILKAYRKGVPITSHVIKNLHLHQRNPAHIAEVVQWGTMIVFDYLTGNYDRIASMQDAADKENDPKIIEEPIRNLRKSSQDNKLWLIDNESGLLDAYELLEPYHPTPRFSTFHKQMLETMCIFQSSLVNSILKLAEQPSPHLRLLNFAGSFEPLMSSLPEDEHFNLFVQMFDQRLADVVKWIKHCQAIEAG